MWICVSQSKEGAWGHRKGAAELHLDPVTATAPSRLGLGRGGAATRLEAEVVMPLLGHSLAEKLQRASSSNYGPVNVPGRARAITGSTAPMAEGSVGHRGG